MSIIEKSSIAPNALGSTVMASASVCHRGCCPCQGASGNLVEPQATYERPSECVCLLRATQQQGLTLPRKQLLLT